MPTLCLVDANSFYCSAETLFKPWLRDKPVVCASNNDGCIVSRNDAAKRLGIKMGTPLFQINHLVESGALHVFSSNYALYQSLSNRMMSILHELSPICAAYSVDEAFCDISGIADPEAWARNAQTQIAQRLGLPVGVGVSSTKTLAKLANWAAKKWKVKTGCVVDLTSKERQVKLLKVVPVSEVWGIGPRLSERLMTEIGVHTAWDLASADPKFLRRQFNVNVERTARELNGLACFDFIDGSPERKQQIICSRSFGQRVYRLDDLKRAVAGFAATAAMKLRSQGSLANCLQVFAHGNRFSDDCYSGSRIVVLPYPTDDSRDLTQAAMAGLEQFYREGPAYAKAGVILSQFVGSEGYVMDMFAPQPRKESQALMKVMDAINAKQGRGSIRIAREGLPGTGDHAMKRDRLTPAYTTDWRGLPKARC